MNVDASLVAAQPSRSGYQGLSTLRRKRWPPIWPKRIAGRRLVPPAGAYVGVLHCDGPPPPINLPHHSGTDTGALALVNIAVDVEARMHHRDVRRQKAYMHPRRLAVARSKRPVGTVQAPHQIPEAVAGLGPCAVDGNELGIVNERLDHGVRVVSAPCLIEPQFNLTDRIFICLGHDDLSRLAAVHAPRDCDVRLAGRVSHGFVASVELNAIARVGQDLDDEASDRMSSSLGSFYPFGLPSSPRRELWPDRSSRCRKATVAMPFAAFRGCPCRSCLRGALPRPRCHRLAAACAEGRGVPPRAVEGRACRGNVRWSVAGMDMRISFSMPRRYAASSLSQSEIATPAAPARAVRPMRCT